jgi:Zn-dependent protease with chaperone function
VLGIVLDPNTHKHIYDYINSIANKLNAKAPKHIVVGLDPNFYVTNANVNVLGKNTTLNGETLYISLPLLRILTKNEFRSVIGHELGHFRGKDTYYSLKFSPVYSGLTHAISSIDTDDDGGVNITTLPAYALLTYMIGVFDKNISSINRTREFEADNTATEIAPALALASALLKMSLYAHFWGGLTDKVIDRLRKGTVTRNLSLIFADTVKYDVDEDRIPEVIKGLSEERISHPTDSHPPTIKRIEKLGININNIDYEILTNYQDNAVDLINGHVNIEEELTTLQQQYYVALGVEVPDEEEVNTGARLLAALGAHMVLADGKIEKEEIEKAENIGLSLIDTFDRYEFREYCNYPDIIPELDVIINIAADFDDEIKELIHKYLTEIAGSDGAVSIEEKELLTKVETHLKI